MSAGTKILGWHVRGGLLGLRLFQLHLLWLGHVLLGGIVLGVFPATAAVYAMIRSDLRDDPSPDGLVREFQSRWRQSFGPANLLGVVLAVGWGLLVVDRMVLARLDLGSLAPVLSGLLIVLTVVGFVITAAALPLAAHFAESPLATLRRACVLMIARPTVAGLNAATVAIVLGVYYLVPGLLPVFGVPAAAYLSFAYLWRSGVLPATSRRTSEPMRDDNNSRSDGRIVSDRPESGV